MAHVKNKERYQNKVIKEGLSWEDFYLAVHVRSIAGSDAII